MQIRPFTEADYPAYAALVTAAHPDSPRTEADIRLNDEARTPDEVSARFLAEEDGQVVGAVGYEYPIHHPAPGRLLVYQWVRPGAEHLVEPLWAFLMEQVEPQKPTNLLSRAREDWPELAFYQAHGFREMERMWASALDVSAFDPAPFLAQARRVEESGIRIVTLADRPYQDEAYQRRHYELIAGALADVPSAEAVQPWPFELWQKRAMQSPRLMPEGYFIAMDGDVEVGVSQLWHATRERTVQTGLTGTRKEYRRRGIALALKLKATLFAREAGYRYIRTSNHSINRPMLAINEALGFVKEPAWVHLSKEMAAP